MVCLDLDSASLSRRLAPRTAWRSVAPCIAPLLLASCLASRPRPPFDPVRLEYGAEELVEFGREGIVEQAPGAVVTYPVEASAPFDRVLATWNVSLPPGTGYEAELRVRPAGRPWSPWHFLDAMGTVPVELLGERRVESEAGRVDVDEFTARVPMVAAQVRFRLHAAARVERVAFSLRRVGVPAREPGAPSPLAAPGLGLGGFAIPVPPESQFEADPVVGPRICTPTSVAMVLEAAGLRADPVAVARVAYDPLHDLYGNWVRAIETSWIYGLPGRAAHLSGLDDLLPWLAGGHPVVCSIAFGDGELSGAPIASTEGHLLVVRGFTPTGDVLVADPAARDSGSVLCTYDREEFRSAWLGHGGVALLLGELPHAPEDGGMASGADG